MLDTDKFITQLVTAGFSHLCVVPCSFAKDLISASMNRSDEIEYLPCASEAVACSTAAGLKMAGSTPIVIVQSSGLTNMGSCITSLLKPYGIRFPIIVSWRTYQVGDSEVQHAHLSTELPALVAAYGYEHCILDQENMDTAVQQLQDCEKRFQLCLLQPKTFSPVELREDLKLDLSGYPKRSEYLKILNNKFSNSDVIFIGTTGNTAREMYVFQPQTNNFYMAGNMGGALSLGLGSALAGKQTFVCGGDAEFVMHMGGLTTAGRYQNRDIRLGYLLFDNESNKSTGGQPSFQSHVDYLSIACGAGLETSDETVETLVDFSRAVEDISVSTGIRFLHIKCSYDGEVERPVADAIVGSQRVFK